MTEQRFDIAISTKEINERGSRTDHSLKDKVPWVGKLDDVIRVTVDADWAGDPHRSVTDRSKLKFGQDRGSADAIIQRLGPGRRAKHLEVQTMWFEQLNKIGLISLNKLSTLENVADLLTKQVPRAVLDKLAGMMDYTFPDEETQKSFKSTRTSIRLIGSS